MPDDVAVADRVGRAIEPGALPYQKPVTPSRGAPGSSATSWVPPTAVAASSSLTAGCELDRRRLQRARARCDLLVQPAERRARVAADEHAGVLPARGVKPALVDQQAHERLDAGQEDLP